MVFLNSMTFHDQGAPCSLVSSCDIQPGNGILSMQSLFWVADMVYMQLIMQKQKIGLTETAGKNKNTIQTDK